MNLTIIWDNTEEMAKQLNVILGNKIDFDRKRPNKKTYIILNNKIYTLKVGDMILKYGDDLKVFREITVKE